MNTTIYEGMLQRIMEGRNPPYIFKEKICTVLHFIIEDFTPQKATITIKRINRADKVQAEFISLNENIAKYKFVAFFNNSTYSTYLEVKVKRKEPEGEISLEVSL